MKIEVLPFIRNLKLLKEIPEMQPTVKAQLRLNAIFQTFQVFQQIFSKKNRFTGWLLIHLINFSRK